MKTLHLIPNTLGSRTPEWHLPASSMEALRNSPRLIAESESAARRLLKDAFPQENPKHKEIFLLNEHSDPQDLVELIQWFRYDEDIALVSDSGCPGVADPGAPAVRIAYNANWKVIPHIGPSSILLALMASGMNGQQFAFKGYLPRDPKRRDHLWKEMREGLQRRKETQIFMEPPYRNQTTFKECLDRLSPDQQLCVAVDLTLDTEWVCSLSVEEWKKAPSPDLQKRPCLFLLGH